MSVRITQVANPTTGGPPVGVRCRVGYAATFIAMLATLAVVALGSTTPRAAAAPRAAPTLAGTWQALPPAPIAPFDARLVSVWTGREMVLFDRVFGASQGASMNAAAAYDPARGAWRTLTPPPNPGGNYEGSFVGAWTGREALIGGPLANLGYNPATNRWRRLPVSLGGPLSVWTGREVISWGGGCCGDASRDGAAYNPATNRVRILPSSPLAPSQQPVGAWTGRELIILVSGRDPFGKSSPASLARAAAYNPATNRWRRIAPLPASFGTPRAVWEGRRFLLVGAGKRGVTALAYNPTTNRWRTRASLPTQLGRGSSPVVWTGRRMMLWRARDGLAYNPRTNRWTMLPRWPVAAHDNATMVWTGRALIVWGGRPGEGADGAAFTPAIP